MAGTAIEEAAAELGTTDLAAVGFTVFFEVAHSLIVVPLASSIRGGRPLRLDLEHSRLRVGIEHGRLWPVPVPVPAPVPGSPVPTGRAVDDLGPLGSWLGAELGRVATAFGPHLRVGPRSYAEAAGSMMAGQADRIGRRFGGLARARQVAATLAAAAGTAVRPPRYVDVDLGPVRVRAPRPGVCCRWYRVSDDAFCAGCPREPEPSRSEHHRDWLIRTLLSGPVPIETVPIETGPIETVLTS